LVVGPFFRLLSNTKYFFSPVVDKKRLYKRVMDHLDERLISLEKLQEDLRDELTRESKSSAGDKYETSRAMTHLEQEKLLQQQHVFTQMKARLSSLNPDGKHEKIGFGSLVKTTEGWYFLSVALGEILCDDLSVFVLSNAAPLAQILTGKKAGNTLFFQGKEIKVLEVT
jgi:transcription elongation GreA/GreB family factor